MARPKRARVPFPALCLIALVPLLVPPGTVPPPGTARGANTAPVEILTFHGDFARTGWNPDERALTPATVRPGAFGRLWSAPVEGELYAEPLVAAGVPVSGTPRTVVYAVTEHDLVYAFDAAAGGRLWGPISLGTPVSRADLPCGNIEPVGITSTPVIDLASSTLYVAGLTTPDAGRTKVYKIAALDLATGDMRSGWPVVIAPPVTSGLQFDPGVQQQRGALTLLRGVVYVPFGGYWGDCGNYHGWVVGVPVSAPSQQQAFVTPTHREGGIWAAGGLAADAAGSLYAATGNSDSEAAVDLGNSVVRLTTVPGLAFSGRPADFFTPSNFVALNQTDTDLGSTAPLVLPAQPDSSTPDLVFIAGKQGVAYLINRANMGGLTRPGPVEGVYSRCLFGDCRSGGPKVFSATAYWDGGSSGRLILVPGRGRQPAGCQGDGGVVALRLEAAPGTRASMFRVQWCSPSMGDPGAPSVSGVGPDGGLVWAVDTGAGVLYAFNAATGAQVYASSGQDTLGSTHRFISPAVASGRVYVTTDTAVVSYGLR
ncbi:MAG TPA: PQQ-binding-like beta-propeller repeat protein [bacterium]|nr:PQQ-binding-like beta-propeller repeat protein [bacterium]